MRTILEFHDYHGLMKSLATLHRMNNTNTFVPTLGDFPLSNSNFTLRQPVQILKSFFDPVSFLEKFDFDI